jgi:hypothetical protein
VLRSLDSIQFVKTGARYFFQLLPHFGIARVSRKLQNLFSLFAKKIL